MSEVEGGNLPSHVKTRTAVTGIMVIKRTGVQYQFPTEIESTTKRGDYANCANGENQILEGKAASGGRLPTLLGMIVCWRDFLRATRRRFD